MSEDGENSSRMGKWENQGMGKQFYNMFKVNQSQHTDTKGI